MTAVLVLGGARSGKSRYAERLLSAHPHVVYLAPEVSPDPKDPDADQEWLARILAHQARRPQHWTTREGADLAAAIHALAPGEAALLDCLGTWVTRLVDEADAWSDPPHARELVGEAVHGLAAAVRTSAADVVLVSNEVGMGVVPASASGRLFADLLGEVNATMATACERVALVAVGRVLDLSQADRIDSAVPLAAGAEAGAESAPPAIAVLEDELSDTDPQADSIAASLAEAATIPHLSEPGHGRHPLFQPPAVWAADPARPWEPGPESTPGGRG